MLAAVWADGLRDSGEGEEAVTDLVERLTEEERARIQAARNRGEICALCGRALVAGETLWHQRVLTAFGYSNSRRPSRMRRSVPVYWQAPVGRECASADTLRETEGRPPATCAGCGRPFYPSPHVARRPASCSRRCDDRHRRARAKEGTR